MQTMNDNKEINVLTNNHTFKKGHNFKQSALVKNARNNNERQRHWRSRIAIPGKITLANSMNIAYKDCLNLLEIQLSIIAIANYSHFMDNLEDAFRLLETKYNDCNIDDLDGFELLCLMAEVGPDCKLSSTLLQIIHLVSIVENRTPTAIPALRYLIDKLMRSLRHAISQVGDPDETIFRHVGANEYLRENIKDFYTLIEHEFLYLTKLTDEEPLCQEDVTETVEKLAEEYDNWPLVDGSYQPEGVKWMFFLHAVICDGKHKKYYHDIIIYLLSKEDLKSIDKITRIHSELLDIISNIKEQLKSSNYKPVVVRPDLKDKVKLFAASIREAVQPLSSPNSSTVSDDIPAGHQDEWVTVTYAAKKLMKSKGTISRWADTGKLKGNGCIGPKRRLLMTSVLRLKEQKENEDKNRDDEEVLRDRRKS